MSRKFYPTLHQHLATDTRRNLAVTAGAGTGKTEVLTRRIIRILKEEKLFLNRIAAVTFTEKAALELKERIRQAIDDELEKHGEPHFKDLKDSFLDNYISTIHAFCAALLREYPVEADLDPYFRVLDETDKYFLLRRVIRQTVDALARTKDDHIMVLGNELSRGEIVNTLFRIVQQREAAASWIDRMNDLSWNDHKKNIINYRRSIVREICFRVYRSDELKECLRLLKEAKLADEADTTKYTLARNGLLEMLPLLLEVLKQAKTGDVDPDELIELRDRIAVCYKLQGRPAKSWMESPESLELFKEAIARLGYIINDLDLEPYAIHWAREEQGYRLSRALAAAASVCLAQYDSEKEKENYLDFQDLQLKTYLFLTNSKNENVRQELKMKFRHIMVDEFQDTNSLQWEIIRTLSGDKKNIIAGNKVFIVGDEKQSIYSFRGGDVSLFSRVRDHLKKANRRMKTDRHPYSLKLDLEKDYTDEYDKRIPDKEDIKKGEIFFNENFRSARIPVKFYNSFFDRLFFRKYYEDYEARPQRLEARGNPGEGSVAFYLIDKAKYTKEEDFFAMEAQMIAAKIREVMEGDDPRFNDVREKAGRGEPAIAILLNRRRRLKNYEDILRSQGLQFIVVRGRGFFQRPEIMDLANLLCVLAAPHRSLLLAGVMRSDAFHIPDEDILLLRHKVPGETLMEKLMAACSLKKHGSHFPGKSGEALHFLHECLSRWQILKDRLPLPELLQLVLEETGQWAALPRGYRGTQALSNTEKLIEMARAAGEQMGFYQFTEWLEERVNHIENEGEADVDLSLGGAIQLMTVHQSKGLEFPLVFVPDMNAGFNLGEREPVNFDYITETLEIKGNRFKRKNLPELGINAPDPEDQYNNGPTLIKRIIHYTTRQKLLAERKRLFYVAATRARDHLILVGQVDTNSTRKIKMARYAPLHQLPSWMDWCCKLLNIYDWFSGTLGTLRLEDEETLEIPYIEYKAIPKNSGCIRELATDIE